MSFASARAAQASKPSKKTPPKPHPRPKARVEGKQKPGRPTMYSPELAEAICTRIAMRESLSNICAEPDMPTETTIYKWKQQRPEFSDLVRRAREHRAEARADHMDDLAADLRAGKLDPHAARVLLEHERWQAGKENKRYADHAQIDVTSAGQQL